MENDEARFNKPLLGHPPGIGIGNFEGRANFRRDGLFPPFSANTASSTPLAPLSQVNNQRPPEVILHHVPTVSAPATVNYQRSPGLLQQPIIEPPPQFDHLNVLSFNAIPRHQFLPLLRQFLARYNPRFSSQYVDQIARLHYAVLKARAQRRRAGIAPHGNGGLTVKLRTPNNQEHLNQRSLFNAGHNQAQPSNIGSGPGQFDVSAPHRGPAMRPQGLPAGANETETTLSKTASPSKRAIATSYPPNGVLECNFALYLYLHQIPLRSIAAGFSKLRASGSNFLVAACISKIKNHLLSTLIDNQSQKDQANAEEIVSRLLWGSKTHQWKTNLDEARQHADHKAGKVERVQKARERMSLKAWESHGKVRSRVKGGGRLLLEATQGRRQREEELAELQRQLLETRGGGGVEDNPVEDLAGWSAADETEEGTLLVNRLVQVWRDGDLGL